MQAQSIVKSSVLDNGEKIPRIMRMSSYVPINIPISFGMLISAPTIPNTIFWQWFNQSINAGVTYGNRNTSSNYTNQDLIYGYTAAIASSLSVAVLLRKSLANMTSTLSGSRLILMNSFVNLMANCAANFLNTYCMRRTEKEKGIEVFADEELT